MPDYSDMPPAQTEASAEDTPQLYYKIRFRNIGQEFTAQTNIKELRQGSRVMVHTDHGVEPAAISGSAACLELPDTDRQVHYTILRTASAEEEQRYEQLFYHEKEAYRFCQDKIESLALPMHLVRVERFFNGSKIIFYFTAENRVDFRELVKLLVQEFRTRVEMRQIGVRHETQMLGDLGYCGRELCCSSYLKNFASVSIKMAKTQDLPLNPSKISGICNRLLCCLTYEYENYKKVKKEMPRIGRTIVFAGEEYKIIRQLPLSGELMGIKGDGEGRIFSEEQWRSAQIVQKTAGKKNRKRQNTSSKS